MNAATTSEDTDALAGRLKLIRERLGKTQAEFAEAIGVSRSFLSEMESGRSKPSIQTVLGVARAFPAIDRDWLLRGGNGPMAYWDTHAEKRPWAGAVRFGGDVLLSAADPDALVCAASMLAKIRAEQPGTLKPNRELEFILIIYNFYIGAWQDAFKIEEWRSTPRAYAEKVCAEWAERFARLRADDDPSTGHDVTSQ